MSAFKHLDGMVALLSEIYEINERVILDMEARGYVRL